MPPTLVMRRRPLPLICATMPPSVSVWASSSSASCASSPPKSISTPPLRVIFASYPIWANCACTYFAAFSVYPDGLSIPSSRTVFSSASCAYFSCIIDLLPGLHPRPHQKRCLWTLQGADEKGRSPPLTPFARLSWSQLHTTSACLYENLTRPSPASPPAPCASACRRTRCRA